MVNLKDFARRQIAQRGWFLRKIAGLPAGVELEREWYSKAGLTQPSTILDVGAHRGETAERFTCAFPRAKIFSCEPVSANFAVLAERVRSWPNVDCYQIALSDRTGDAKIVIRTDSQTHTLENTTDSTNPADCRFETVKVMTLDDFAARHKIDTLDLLKIDTEGHEVAVLRGAQNLLTQHRIRALFLEASIDPTDTSHTSLSIATGFIQKFGFKLAGIYDQVVWRNPTRLAYFNAFFVCDFGGNRTNE